MILIKAKSVWIDDILERIVLSYACVLKFHYFSYPDIYAQEKFSHTENCELN